MYKNLFIILNILISIILTIIFANVSIVMVNLIMLTIMILLLRKENKDIYKHLTIIYIISISAMLLLYFGYIAKYEQPYYLGGSDDANFEIWANRAIELNDYTIKDINENREFKYYNCNGFIWFVSMIIRFCNLFGGYHTVVIRLINIYLLTYTGLLVFKHFSKDTMDICKKKIFILYLTVLFPNALYISIHGFRDVLFAFIIFSIFYLMMNIKQQNIFTKIFSIIYMIMASYLAYYIRSVGIIYIGLIIILNFIFKENKIKKEKTNKVTLTFFIFVFVCVVLAVKFNLIAQVQKYLNRYNEYILGDADGLSRLVFLVPIFPFGILLRVIYGNIFPSPTGILLTSLDINSICNFIISIGTILQVYMLPYVFKNIKKIDSVLIMYIVIFLSIIITTFSFRHFIILYPFMFLLFGRQYIKEDKDERKKYIKIVTLFIVLGISIYLINELS